MGDIWPDIRVEAGNHEFRFPRLKEQGKGTACYIRRRVNKCRMQHDVQKTHHWGTNHRHSIARSIFRRMALDPGSSAVAPSFSNDSIAHKISAFPSSSRPCWYKTSACRSIVRPSLNVSPTTLDLAFWTWNCASSGFRSPRYSCVRA